MANCLDIKKYSLLIDWTYSQQIILMLAEPL